MLPRWSEDYSIDNPRIDEQHKKLFELASNVEAIADRSVSKKKIKDMLTEFFHYMKYHFSDEEAYMEEIGYPELEPHRRIHKEIIQSMVHLISSVKTTNDLKERLYTISKKWLLEHILFEDMKITEFVRTPPVLDALIETDEGASYIDEENTPHEGYFYTCGCAQKLHNVSLDVHQKIQVADKDVRCRDCDESIKFFKKDLSQSGKNLDENGENLGENLG